MMNWLTQHFEIGRNYLIAQQHREQLNTLIFERLVAPFQIGRKQHLWGELARQLPAIGRRLGWVPNQIQALFLNRTVEEEIADAAGAAERLLRPQQRHLELAIHLLDQLRLSHLAHRPPLSLSEGETKIVWLLTQWVKSADYLVIGDLPANLFAPKVAELTDFILAPSNRRFGPKTIILGYQPDQIDWCRHILARSDWLKLPFTADMGANEP